VVVHVNGDDVEAPDGCLLGELLEQLGLGRRLIVVERNGEPVPRAQVATTALAPGDRLELVRAVAGG
jgi:sulfur carrier protein